MADVMQFDLVSPERKLASVAAREVQVPGAEGDLTAMPDHSPLITTLRPGLLTVVSADGTQEYVVTGGFAEISPAGISVLAERAMARDEVTQEILDGLVADATAAKDAAAADAVDAAAKTLADILAVGSAIGLSAKTA